MRLYVIGNIRQGWYKIGISECPQSRIGSIQTGCPFEVEVVVDVEVEQAHALEGVLHEYYKDRRLMGEWFRLDERDVEYVREISPGFTVEHWEQGNLPEILTPDEQAWRDFLGPEICAKYPDQI